MTEIQKAQMVFDAILNLDGCGLVTTDEELILEEVANYFGIDPDDLDGDEV